MNGWSAGSDWISGERELVMRPLRWSWRVLLLTALAVAFSASPARADDADAAFRHELVRDHVWYRIEQFQWATVDVLGAAGITAAAASGNRDFLKIGIPAATSALISGIWWMLPNQLAHERQQRYAQATTLTLIAASLTASAFMPGRKGWERWALGFGTGIFLTMSLPYWFQEPVTDAEALSTYEMLPEGGRARYRATWRATNRRHWRNMNIALGSGYWACAMAAFVGGATSRDGGPLYFFGALSAAMGTINFVF